MKLTPQIGTIFCTDRLTAVTTDRVRNALECSGLDPELARDLGKRFCFTRAKNKLRSDGLIDEVEEDEARWTWQLSKRYREDNRLTYEFDSQFWFVKGTSDVGADNDILLERVRELFNQYGGVYLPSDVTKLIRRLFDRQKGMIPLRHNGVVYFVPSENQPLVDKVSNFIKDIGGEFVAADVGHGATLVREKVMSMFVESVQGDLAKIVAEIKTLRESNQPLSARKANNRWKELLAQLERVKVFARSLRTDTDELLGKVRSSELDLSLVGEADIDVIAALAQAGKLDNALGQIARTAFEGELPALDSPAVAAFMPTVDMSPNLPSLPAFELQSVSASACLVEV